jgi:hypothetical protein
MSEDVDIFKLLGEIDLLSPKRAMEVRKLVMAMSPSERGKLSLQLFAAERNRITQIILKENPGISAGGIRRELFLKLYGNDFSAEEKEKIIKCLEQ